MNWVYVLLALCAVVLLLVIILATNNCDEIAAIISCCGMVVILGLFISLIAAKENIEDKYNWYMETRLKYAEAEGIEKEYLEMTDVMTYNLWYTENKADLEDRWNFKSAAGCEFDYIKIQGD